MVGCLIIENSSENVENRDRLLEHLLLHLAVKKDVDHHSKLIIFYVFDSDKRTIWQIALHLTIQRIKVGYGFGENKREAKYNAEKRLAYMINEQQN